MADLPLPVIVSIATLPSRIANMRPTLESLLEGELVPDRILVIVTEYSAREKSAYVIPDFLRDEQFTRGVIEIVVASRDWGPGTKLLGALEWLEEPCLLVLADDDVAYAKGFLSALASRQAAYHGSSFSYFTYRTNGLTVGQGCDGFSFHSPNLDGIRAFFDEHVAGSSLQYHDDLWISFFLFKRGIDVRRVPPPRNASNIYVQTIADESLRDLTGDTSRDRIVREGLPRLVRSGGLTGSQKIALARARYRDMLRQLPARLLNRGRILIGSHKARI